jgi:RimJ/RimL family protein N-acetyltransferase
MTVWPPEVVLDVAGAVLRAPDPIDGDAMASAVNASLEHLRGFLSWAEKPATVDQQAVRLAIAAEAFAVGGDAIYTLVAGDDVIGSVSLHRRLGPGALEIGYWVRADHEGQGLVTAAVRALVAVGFESDGAERIVIRCDEANVRSAAVAQRVGFTLVEARDRPKLAPSQSGRELVWERRR